MSKEVFDLFQFHAVLQQVRGDGVAKGMEANGVAYPGRFSKVLDAPPDAWLGQPFAFARYEQRLFFTVALYQFFS
jgi:hypothetical protein